MRDASPPSWAAGRTLDQAVAARSPSCIADTGRPGRRHPAPAASALAHPSGARGGTPPCPGGVTARSRRRSSSVSARSVGTSTISCRSSISGRVTRSPNGCTRMIRARRREAGVTAPPPVALAGHTLARQKHRPASIDSLDARVPVSAHNGSTTQEHARWGRTVACPGRGCAALAGKGRLCTPQSSGATCRPSPRRRPAGAVCGRTLGDDPRRAPRLHRLRRSRRGGRDGNAHRAVPRRRPYQSAEARRAMARWHMDTSDICGAALSEISAGAVIAQRGL